MPTTTDPWVNNFTPAKGYKFGRPVIPDIQKDANGFPILPTGAFKEDTDVPWADRRYDYSIEKILGAGSQMAGALDQVVEGRGRQAEDLVRGALNASSGPAMSQKDIDLAYGQEADRIGGGFNDDMASLRNYLGGSGVTGGGYAAGLASQYQLARMGQITDARRSLQLEATKMNTAKKMADFNNTLSLASIVNRDPSMLGMDWTQNVLDLRLQQQGVEKQDQAARAQAKASKKAGTLAGIGSIVGAIGGLL